ncbi:MAG: hypothetical protein GF320_20375 [Armatimonadia bacterium]|nr:hypothetical protein [Armatimonadia bacterium]
MTDGVRRLVAGFSGTSPGRQCFGEQRGWLSDKEVVSAPDDFPLTTNQWQCRWCRFGEPCGRQPLPEVLMEQGRV